MHTRGRPAEWQTLPPLPSQQVIPLVREELKDRLREAEQAGIASTRIVLDPGLGFGKVFDQNYSLLAGFEKLAVLNRPLLAGPSRKGFLGRTLAPLYQGKDASVDRRASASLAAVTAAILAGAHLVRVHDVRPSREAACHRRRPPASRRIAGGPGLAFETWVSPSNKFPGLLPVDPNSCHAQKRETWATRFWEGASACRLRRRPGWLRNSQSAIGRRDCYTPAYTGSGR